MLKTQECAACDLGLIHNLEYAHDLGLIHNLEYTHQTPLFKKRDIGAIALKLFLHDKKNMLQLVNFSCSQKKKPRWVS